MVIPHKLSLQLFVFADQPFGLLAQLVPFRVTAMFLTAFAHRLSHLIVGGS
jgi:hypothetical protein